MAEVVAIQFEGPAGERVRFEWSTDDLLALSGRALLDPPPWRLEGELDWDSLEAVRAVSASLADGRLVVVAALRPAGAGGHGDELVAGAIGTVEGFAQLDEVLLSTEYDASGLPRRIGLELGHQDGAIPTRVAADVTEAGSELRGGTERTAALLAVRSAGENGSGTLDVIRPLER